MTQGIFIGMILAIVGYAAFRALARLAMAPWSAEWLDRRAMIARAESDALRAAQEVYAQTCARWKGEEVADAEAAE